MLLRHSTAAPQLSILCCNAGAAGAASSTATLSHRCSRCAELNRDPTARSGLGTLGGYGKGGVMRTAKGRPATQGLDERSRRLHLTPTGESICFHCAPSAQLTSHLMSAVLWQDDGKRWP
ncbi:unnamed protein product [Pleuronectes platessa]|uniref:Uncharacterized protein n=1 Tax=Pleuronectes platessa TaxID=8262 RepID=A0A9N7UNM0_PLEPL|nr:unnamed protein product [Pleuronectes platessa]